MLWDAVEAASRAEFILGPHGLISKTARASGTATGVLGARVNVDHRCLHKRVPELLLDGQEMRSAME
jgi:hypothetical protein